MDALSLEVDFSTMALVAAQFSLSSTTVAGTPATSGADVLFYDGAATILAHPAPDFGLQPGDDIDALEAMVPEPGGLALLLTGLGLLSAHRSRPGRPAAAMRK